MFLEKIDSGKSNSTGGFNTFLGFGSGQKNTTAAQNTFIGSGTGFNTTTGAQNTFIGDASGFRNTTGISNVFVGVDSGKRNTTGFQNTNVGVLSGVNTSTGRDNAFFGYASGYSNTSGQRNVFIGPVFVGNDAGKHLANNQSNKLVIANNGVSSLLYGDFATKTVGVNTENIPAGYNFAVGGKIITEELKVQLRANGVWPDYVFESDYILPELKEVEAYVNKNGHLENIPSAEEVEKQGGVLVVEKN